MARTGSIVYTSATYGSNERLVSYNYFTMNYTSGSWPGSSSPYRITSVICEYSKSQAGYTGDTLYKYNDTDGVTLGVSGSYWTGVGRNAMYTDSNIYTSSRFPTTSGSSWRLRMYASGDSAGILTNNTNIKFTINWELTESGSTFTLAESTLTLMKDQSVTATLNVTEGTSIGKHTVKIEYGSTAVMSETEVTLSNSTVALSLASNTYAAKLPSSTSGVFVVTLYSYSSSDTTRLVGTAQQNLTLNVGNTYAPTLTATISAQNNRYNDNLLRYVSSVTITTTPTYYGGATGSTFVFSGQNINKRVTASGTSASTATTDIFQQSGTFAFTVTLTDSRGFTATATTANVTVLEYSPPTGSLAAVRYDSTTQKADASGESARVTLSNLKWSSDISGNTITLQLEYKRRSDSSYTTHTEAFTTTMPSSVIIANIISRDSEYDFRVKLEDAVQQSTTGLTVNTLTATLAAADAFFIFSKAADKQYFGFGSYPAHTECVEVKPDWQFYTHGKEITDLIKTGRNLIRGLTHPTFTEAEAPTLNGFHLPSGDSVIRTTSANVVLEAAENGIKTVVETATRPQLFFGHSTVNTQKAAVNDLGTKDGLMGLKPGRTYTISADLSLKLLTNCTNTSSYPVQFWTRWVVNGAQQAAVAEQTIVTITNAQKGQVVNTRMEIPFTVPDGAESGIMYLRCYSSTASFYAVGDYMEFRNFKLEEGDTATVWSPAPEDGEGDFRDYVVTGVATANSAASAVSDLSDDVADLGAHTVTPDTSDSSQYTPSTSCIITRYGTSVHLQYVTASASVQNYDVPLLMLPEGARPSVNQFVPAIYGNRGVTGGNVGYGIVKIYTDGSVKTELFSGLMHAGGSSTSDSTQTSVYINAWYEL